jgi:hypothetical protein
MSQILWVNGANMVDLRQFFTGSLGTSMKLDIKVFANWIRAGDGQFTRIDPMAVDFKGKITKYAPQNMDISILLEDEQVCTVMFLGRRVKATYSVAGNSLLINFPEGPLAGTLEVFSNGAGTRINVQVFGGYPLYIHPAA